MWSNPQNNVDLVTFTEETFSWKVHFLCRVHLVMIVVATSQLFRHDNFL